MQAHATHIRWATALLPIRYYCPLLHLILSTLVFIQPAAGCTISPAPKEERG